LFFLQSASTRITCRLQEKITSIYKLPKGPRRHKETWWWNEEVAEAVRDKKIKYGKWKKENTEDARMEYKKSRQMQRELSLQQRKRSGQMT